MKITKASFGKTYLALGENFDLSFTLQMAAGESIYKKYGGSVKVTFAPSPMPNLNDETWGVPWIENISISDGGSKTFSVTGLKIPAADDTSITGNGQTFEEWFKSNMDDAGTARAWPVSIGVLAMDDYGEGRTYEAIKNGVVRVLLSRIKPELTGCTISDVGTADAIGLFGGFIQGQSKPQFDFTAKLDPLDPTLKIKTRKLLVTDPDGAKKAYYPAGLSFTIDAPAKPGAYSWEFSITDSAGNTSESNEYAAGTFNVLAYTPPKINSFNVTRYTSVTDGAGNTTYTEDEEGQNVWIDFDGEVMSLAGANAWSLEFAHDKYVGDIEGVVNSLVGIDGEKIKVTADRTMITSQISATHSYEFTATLSDTFSSVSRTVVVPMAGADFEIGQFGIGDGGPCTGDRGNPKSDFYRLSEFHGGIVGVTTYAAEEVKTGGTWIDGKPIYRRAFEVDVVANEAKYLAHGGDLGVVLRLDGTIYTGDMFYPLSYHYGDNSTRMRLFATGSSVVVVSTNTGKAVIIMEYTKASDSAVDPNADWLQLMTSDGKAVVTSDGYYVMVKKGG